MPEIPMAPDPPFRTYSVAEGLNQKTVTSIVQDEDGVLWIATFGGLNRFDGTTFESFTTRQGLRQNLILYLMIDSQQRLWAGDNAGGLTVIENGEVVRTIEPDSDNPGTVRSLVEMGDTLYIATQPGGLSKLALDDLDAGIRPVAGSPSSLLYLAARGDQIFGLDDADRLYAYRPDQPEPFEVIAEEITALVSNGAGEVYVANQSNQLGLLRSDAPAADIFDWFDGTYPGEITGLVFDKDDLKWVFQESVGISPFGKPDMDSMMPIDWSIIGLIDNENVLWVPTRRGLSRYLGPRFRHYTIEIDGIAPEIFAMQPMPDGQLWMGTSAGLVLSDAEGNLTNVSDLFGVQRREVRDLRLAGDGRTLWAIQVDGVAYRIDTGEMTHTTFLEGDPQVLVGLELDPQGKVWAGSYYGNLYAHDPKDGSTRQFELGNGAAIYSLDMGSDGYMWFTVGYRGLYRINTRDPEASPEKVVDISAFGAEFFSHVVVVPGASGDVAWIAMVDGGIYRWSDGALVRIIDDPALSDQIIYSIQPLVDGTIVFATSRGAYRYDPGTGQLEHYGALDGFVAIEAKVHATHLASESTLWIGTTSGISVMDVSLPMDGVGLPQPMILRRFIDGEVAAGNADAPVVARRGNVQVDYAAVSTRRPDGVEYSYRLVGNDDNWAAPTQSKSISYSNLKPGDYRFEMRARLPGGGWSSAPSWDFHVPTPVWRTKWFIALAVLLVALLSRTVVQFRWRAIERANKRLRQQVAERTESIEAGKRELETINQQLSSEIQERQRADALRADVEARFHQAYQNSPIGMALVDMEGRVYDANPRLKALFWPASPGNERVPLIDVVVTYDRERFTEFLDDFIAGKLGDADTNASMEVDCTADNGAIRRMDFLPSAVRDHNGELQYVVLLAQDVTESHAMTSQLEYQARFDELTGLLNRRAFARRLEQAGAEPNASGQSYLMFLDLDQFKVVNDTCGHAAGDELLRVVAKHISNCVREQDTVARLGGDEFGLILVGCTEEVALARAESVRELVQELEFLWNADVFRIGVSIGIVPIAGGTRDLDELQQLADAACYAAKEAGRNRVHLVSGDRDAVHEHRGEMRWVQRLNHAIDNDKFVLFGQRIDGLTPENSPSKRIEILLRMQDRNGQRLIPPGAFLPAAERYGLQGRLDQWVVNRVITLLTGQGGAAPMDQQVWVNLSGASVGDSNFSTELIRKVADAGLAPGTLNFEITETAVIRKIDEAASLIEALKSMGCRFALDDFGSGLSSFGYLKRLNVDSLKIDGQFIRDIVTDPTDRIFVKSIIDIAHTLGMRVVSEFVEDQEILDMVRELGSDYAQGFGVHRPEPLKNLLSQAVNAQPMSASR